MTPHRLRSVDLWSHGSAVRIAGIVDVERTETGATLSRLPRWARSQIVEPSILQPASYRLRRPASSRTAGRFRPTLLGNWAWRRARCDVP